MNAVQSVSPRLAKLVPLLGSDKPGEVVAAANALKRTLHGAGFDFHSLVAAIEFGWPRLSGKIDVQVTRPDAPQGTQAVARNCIVADGGRLSAVERDFLQTMIHWRGKATERQMRWLNAIAARLGVRGAS